MTALENQPSSVQSPQGRRVLVAVVSGEIGKRIQRWREQYDPHEARRLPPHTTLCYWAPAVDLDLLERQVRHTFESPVTVRLGAVHEFDNDQQTFYVQVQETAPLNAARTRLYDGVHLQLPGYRDWTWHVTCVRESRGRDKEQLRAAATGLSIEAPWRIDTIAYLELRGDLYEPLATWMV